MFLFVDVFGQYAKFKFCMNKFLNKLNKIYNFKTAEVYTPNFASALQIANEMSNVTVAFP